MRDMNSSPVPKTGTEKFAYELYEPDFRRRLGFEFTASGGNVVAKAAERAAGRCGAARLTVRPKDRMVAVVREDGAGGRFWFRRCRLASAARGAEFE